MRLKQKPKCKRVAAALLAGAMMMNVCSVPALAAEGEDDSSDDSESTAAAVVNVETQELGNDGKSVTTTYEDGTVEVVTTAHDEEGNTYTYNSSTLTTETQDPPKGEEASPSEKNPSTVIVTTNTNESGSIIKTDSEGNEQTLKETESVSGTVSTTVTESTPTEETTEVTYEGPKETSSSSITYDVKTYSDEYSKEIGTSETYTETEDVDWTKDDLIKDQYDNKGVTLNFSRTTDNDENRDEDGNPLTDTAKTDVSAQEVLDYAADLSENLELKQDADGNPYYQSKSDESTDLSKKVSENIPNLNLDGDGTTTVGNDDNYVTTTIITEQSDDGTEVTQKVEKTTVETTDLDYTQIREIINSVTSELPVTVDEQHVQMSGNVQTYPSHKITTTINIPDQDGTDHAYVVSVESKNYMGQDDTTYATQDNYKVESTDADGNPVVREITPVTDDDGTIIGYQVATSVTKTIADGATETYTETSIAYATETAKKEIEETKFTKAETTTTTTTTTTVQTEESEKRELKEGEADALTEGTTITQQLVQDEDGNYYLVVTGEMSDVTEGEENGRVILSMTQVDPALLEMNNYGYTSKYYGYGYPESLYLYAEGGNSDPVSDDSPIYLANYRLQSMIETYDGESYSAVALSELRDVDDPNVKYYVLCADQNTDSYLGTGYTMQNIEDAYYIDENGEKQQYFSDEGIERIECIAENGYWAAANTTDSDGNPAKGSLDYVKQLLTENKEKLGVTDDQIAGLSEGAALTATQAALWTYANESTATSGTAKEFTFDTVNTARKYGYFSDDVPAAEALYKLLVEMADEAASGTQTTETTATQVLTTDTFATDASITLHHKSTSCEDTENSAKMLQEAEASDVYDTDLSFSVKVQPSSITGKLLVTVYQDGQAIAVYNLENNEDKNSYDTLTGKSSGDNTTYTIENIKLKEGATVTLNLSGTQNLDKGVYVFMGNNTQTLLGVADGKQQVNMSVDLVFNVEEPDAKLETTTVSNSGDMSNAKYVVETTSKVTVNEDSTVSTKVYANVTNYASTATTESRAWSNETVRLYTDDYIPTIEELTPTPTPSKTPDPIVNPDPDPEPEESENPAPEESESPAPSEEPEETESPEPEETEEPEPEETEEPEPEETESPAPSENPTVTPSASPAPSTSPAPSATPTTSESPAPSEKPTEKPNPDPTTEPKPSSTPVIDRVKPTPDPDSTPKPTEEVKKDLEKNLEDEHEKKKEEIENKEYEDEHEELEDLEELREIIEMRIMYEKAVNPNSELIAELEDELVPLAARIMELIDLDPALDAKRLAELEEFRQYLIDLGLIEVPLAVPNTGDQSAVWAVIALLAFANLMALSMADSKKRKHNN